MEQSYSTAADDASVSSLDLLELERYLYSSSMGMISEPEYFPERDLPEPGYLPDCSTISEMTFTQAAMTSIGALTNSLTQQNDMYQVSKLRFERQH
jgi:hypothetical protein